MEYVKVCREVRIPTDGEMDQFRYDKVTEILQAIFDDEFRYRVPEFKQAVKAYRVKHRKAVQQLLESVFNEKSPVKLSTELEKRLTYRDIPFNVDRYRSCAVCGRLFFDNSGNGRRTVCHYDLLRVNDDGTYYSECERKRDNAKGRKHYSGFSGYISDLKPSLYTEQKLVERPPLYYNPVAKEDSDEWSFFQYVMSQSTYSCDEFQDPQDIVCGETKPTYSPMSNHKKKLPMIRSKDSGGKVAFRVEISSGVKAEFERKNTIPTFKTNSLKIKSESELKPPRNR